MCPNPGSSFKKEPALPGTPLSASEINTTCFSHPKWNFTAFKGINSSTGIGREHHSKTLETLASQLMQMLKSTGTRCVMTDAIGLGTGCQKEPLPRDATWTGPGLALRAAETSAQQGSHGPRMSLTMASEI